MSVSGRDFSCSSADCRVGSDLPKVGGVTRTGMSGSVTRSGVTGSGKLECVASSSSRSGTAKSKRRNVLVFGALQHIVTKHWVVGTQTSVNYVSRFSTVSYAHTTRAS